MTQPAPREFGNNVTVQPKKLDEKGAPHEWHVCRGTYCEKILFNEEEAEDYARKLSRRVGSTR